MFVHEECGSKAKQEKENNYNVYKCEKCGIVRKDSVVCTHENVTIFQNHQQGEFTLKGKTCNDCDETIV